MSTLVIYLLLLGAGFLLGGAYALWKVNKLVSGVLGVTAVLLTTAAVLRIVD